MNTQKFLWTKIIILVLALQFVVIISIFGYKSWKKSSIECVRCHSNKELLNKFSASKFYVTKELVEKQSGHREIECRDCHLGNGRTTNKDLAHKDMLKAIFVAEDGSVLNRFDYTKEPLLPSGKNKINELLPKVSQNDMLYILPDLRNILWHDRNRETFNFDPEIARQTCGKSNCHPNELSQFKTSIMGRNFRQRYMKTWMTPYGPHNCGPSFADLSPDKEIKGSGFSHKNTSEIANHLNVPFTNQQAEMKQKFCNICHAGCLDCHYSPTQEKGVHSFSKVPNSENCAGFGRGTSICHPGAMQSRRGETYIGNDYSVPTGMKPDVHYEKGIKCVDCHQTGEGGMGHIERAATCQDCHIEIEDAISKSPHKKLDCASCHISELRGYQITIWGPGFVGNKINPFQKYSLYYGIQTPPILMKDQKGTWRPYKIWPHSLGNYKDDVPASPSVQFRWPKGETRDAYYIIGTNNSLKTDNKHLLWMEFEQASHPYGKARECSSCHGKRPQGGSHTQISQSKWEFFDDNGAEPFNGEHKIVADSNKLKVEGLHNTTPIKIMKGSKIEDFASWIYMKDSWRVTGSYSIKADLTQYNKYLNGYNKIASEFNGLNLLSLSKEEAKSLKLARQEALHNDLNEGQNILRITKVRLIEHKK